MAQVDQQPLARVGEREENQNGRYIEEPGELFTPEIKDIFENYSKIPSSEVLPHIKEMHRKAWEIFPYPCIGRYAFLDLTIISPNQVFSYSNLISSLKNGQTLLDIGCCVGQDIRKLVHDGAPSENIYGSELRPEFVELGYNLFQDKESLRSKMIAPGDIFDVRDGKGGLHELVQQGGVDNIHASAFIHLFNWEGQIEVCTLLTKLLKNKKGSRIFGRQAGTLDGKGYELIDPQSANGISMWLQDPKSWERLWEEVGKRTGTEGEWEVKSKLKDYVNWNENYKDVSENGASYYLLWFEVVRK